MQLVLGWELGLFQEQFWREHLPPSRRERDGIEL
jgi:hypothetical protein